MRPLSNFVIRHSKLSLFGFIALVLLSLIGGFQAFGNLKGGGYNDPGSDSDKVTQMLVKDFGQTDPEVVLVVDMGRNADDVQSSSNGDLIAAELAKTDGVETVSSYYSLGRTPTLKSKDGAAVYFFAKLEEGSKTAAVSKEIQDTFSGNHFGATIYVAGWGPVTSEINHTIESDLTKAESVAVPVTLLLMIFVFGSVVAAGLPLMIAGLTILGSFFFIWLASLFTDTSTFSVNLVTGLGLGLGIDYALLMVSRFREERAKEQDVATSVEATMLSAGRTVFFSGVTVALVMISMNFFPQYFLKSFAYAGLVAVFIALAAALIALPAMMNLLGDGINKWPLFRHRPQKDEGVWSKLAKFVMRRPVAIILVSVLGLGSLAALGMNVKLGQVDDRILPSNNRVVLATDQIRDRFDGREGSPIEILVKNSDDDRVMAYAEKLSTQAHITRVKTSTGVYENGALTSSTDPYVGKYVNGNWTRIVAIADVEPRSPDGEAVTKDIRAISSNFDQLLVGGSSAIYTDALSAITTNLPWAALWIVFSTMVLLFLFTGSLILPIKAVILNFASLFATMGFLVWVFMDGNLHWLLGDFAATGTIDSSSLVLVAVISFGLSMDYELFLLSRIKEQHDLGLDTTESVAVGLQRSGRIITTAALVLAVSFFAFASSGVSIMKMLGLGIAFAVLLDATVIRALLVPALMRLFGDTNWYAPKWMKWVQKKVGLEH
ncbi:MAG: MMPL family transporter [Rhodoluna sp.]|jgi:RND superfamily putative drug exporter|nr:MMPL family transporter [Rhodoluna sp.]